jgi:hypothetical protein
MIELAYPIVIDPNQSAWRRAGRANFRDHLWCSSGQRPFLRRLEPLVRLAQSITPATKAAIWGLCGDDHWLFH